MESALRWVASPEIGNLQSGYIRFGVLVILALTLGKAFVEKRYKLSLEQALRSKEHYTQARFSQGAEIPADFYLIRKDLRAPQYEIGLLSQCG
jgi:hypothetical protein